MGGQEALPSTQDALRAMPILPSSTRGDVAGPLVEDSARPQLPPADEIEPAHPPTASIPMGKGPRYRTIRRLIKGSRLIRDLLVLWGGWLLLTWVFGG